MAIDSIGPEFRVNTVTNSNQRTNSQSPQSIAMDDTGNFVVTWSSSGQDGSGYGVYGQRYDAAGVVHSQASPLTASDFLVVA